MSEQVRILGFVNHIPPAADLEEEIAQALDWGVDVIVAQGTGSDWGPYWLGSGEQVSANRRAWSSTSSPTLRSWRRKRATPRSSGCSSGPYPGRKTTAGNAAAPIMPVVVPVSDVYSFSIYHLLPLAHPLEPFALTVESFPRAADREERSDALV